MIRMIAPSAVDVDDESGPVTGATFAVQASPAPVLHVTGDVDLLTAPALDEALAPLTSRGGVVGIRLSGLRFMDAAGINVLCAAAHALGDRGRIVLYDPSPRVIRVLEITGLAALVNVEMTAPTEGQRSGSAGDEG